MAKYMDKRVLKVLAEETKVAPWYPAHTLHRADPEHQWSSDTIHGQVKSWCPSTINKVLKLCGSKVTTESKMATVFKELAAQLSDVFGIISNKKAMLPHYKLKDEPRVLTWLESIGKYKEEPEVAKKTDEISETTVRRRAGTFKKKKTGKKKAAAAATAAGGAARPRKKAAKKKAAAAQGNGESRSSFEYQDDMLRMLKRKSGLNVSEVAESWGIEPVIVRRQIDRLRRGGNNIVKISRGVFRIE